jgi:spore photoproduct lyase
MQWKPDEIIVNEKVKDDPTTQSILHKCMNVVVKFVKDGRAKAITWASKVLGESGAGMLSKIIAGKRVMYIAPATDVVDVFTMPDDRLKCPHFERLKLASNGCFYMCDWCYLKLTYRAASPFITVKVQYDLIKEKIIKRVNEAETPIMFNSGELADSLSLEHLTGAAQEFIPLFATLKNGYLFMLTKSTNVDSILDLEHNGHTVIAWSMNNAEVSRRFEIGAPCFEDRLEAAYKVQKAGYPLRLRLDPILPFNGWKEAYAETVKRIYQKVSPERMTLGTLRFEGGFYNMRNRLLSTGDALKEYIDHLEPMFEPKAFAGSKRPKSGKYSFPADKRVEIFTYIINEIRKYSDCTIALCKESAEVWDSTGLDRSKCSCVCQYDYADMGGAK